jgi:hypothetical protein
MVVHLCRQLSSAVNGIGTIGNTLFKYTTLCYTIEYPNIRHRQAVATRDRL